MSGPLSLQRFNGCEGSKLAAKTSVVGRIVAWSCDRALVVTVAAADLGFMALVYTVGHFAMTTDTAKLISPKLEWRINEARFDAAFPQQNDLIVAVVDGVTPELAEEATARLTEKLKSDTKTFFSVKRPDGGAYFDRNGLILLPLSEVQATTEQLFTAQPFIGPLATDPSVRGIMTALSTVLMGVQNGQAKLEDLDRPMKGFANAIDKVLDGKPAFFSWRTLFSGKAAGSRELRHFILVKAKLDYGALEPGASASDAIRAAARSLNIDMAHGAEVRLTGSVPLADDEFASLAQRAGLMMTVMTLAVMGMLWLAVRSFKVIGCILVTTFLGLIMTMGLGLLAVHRFNLISVAFIPLFVGLGVDFGIQFSVRYRHERLLHPNLKTALVAAGTGVGGALALAAVAISVGFFAFLPTSYIGVSELGVIAGLGMVIAFVLSVTLLPALLTLARPKGETKEIGWSELAPLDVYLVDHRRRVLLIAGGAALVCLGLMPFLQFDFNPLHLRSAKAESMQTLADLMTDPDRTPNTIDVLAPSLKAADKLVVGLQALPQVSQAITLSSFVPEHQAEKLALISDASTLLDPTLTPLDIQPAPTDAQMIASLKQTEAALLQAAGKTPTPAADDARRLAGALSRLASASPAKRAKVSDVLVTPLMTLLDQMRAVLQAEPVTIETLPADIRDDWVAKDGRARVQVFPKGDSNDNGTLRRFAKAVRAVAPEATGAPISIQEAGKTIVDAFIKAGVLSFLAIIIILAAVLRSTKDVALTVIPIILTGLLTLGSCVLIGQPINFANIIALPLLFGIGVAFNIYFVMAWRAGETNLLQSSLTRAVLFSALTTATAFGSLWLSSHPGTASMGKLLMISLAWTLVVALLFQPALLGPPPRRRRVRTPRPH